MKRRLLVISVLGTYFLLTWGIGHNDVIEDDHGLTKITYDTFDDVLIPNITSFDDSTHDTIIETKENVSASTVSTIQLDNILPSSQDVINSVTLMPMESTSTEVQEINSHAHQEINDRIKPTSSNQIKSTQYRGPPHHFNISKFISSKTQQVRDTKQNDQFDKNRSFELKKEHKTEEPDVQGVNQGPQQLNYNNPYDSKVMSPSSKFDHIGHNPHMPMMPDFHPHFGYNPYPFEHPNSVPHTFPMFPIQGLPRRRKRPKKKLQQHFLPPPKFSMPDGPYTHEIPHYDMVGPRLPLPRNFNFEQPPLVNPLRSEDHGNIEQHFPSTQDDFKPNGPHFKEPPIYFRPLPPGYIIRCKTNLFFSVFTRRLCYPLPFNPTHVGW